MALEPEYTDCMVDIETTGTQPDRNAIIQIAAVKFNLKKRTVCPVFFNKSLTMPKHRHWDQDTAVWWSKKKSVLHDIQSRAEPHAKIIREFADFSYQTPSMKFWSKPSHFDFMFISSYLSDQELPNPFHYAEAMDVRSFWRGLYYPEQPPEPELAAQIPFSGPAHNALYDTLHQLKLLFAMVDRAEKSTRIQGEIKEAEIVHST